MTTNKLKSQHTYFISLPGMYLYLFFVYLWSYFNTRVVYKAIILPCTAYRRPFVILLYHLRKPTSNPISNNQAFLHFPAWINVICFAGIGNCKWKTILAQQKGPAMWAHDSFFIRFISNSSNTYKDHSEILLSWVFHLIIKT